MKYSTLVLGLLAHGAAALPGKPKPDPKAKAKAEPDAKHPVCIVGAGPAGLRAAHALEELGREVVVLDEKAAAGGKSQAYYPPGRSDLWVPMGALLLENTTYVEGRAVIARTNLRYRPAPALVPKWGFDWRTGDTQPYPQLTKDQKALLAKEVTRYAALWQEQFHPHSAVGYRQGVPANFTVSTAEWLTENKFALMPVLFNGAMFAYGYGDLNEIPVWYMLQYFTPTIVAAFAGSEETPLNAIDFHGVLVQYAEQLKTPVTLGARVTKIERPEAGKDGSVTVTYTVADPKSKTEPRKEEKPEPEPKPNPKPEPKPKPEPEAKAKPEPTTQQCSQLILAFPPTLDNLAKAGLSLTAAEKKLFGAVRTNNYFSGAVSIDMPAGQLWYANSSSAAAAPTDARGQPMGILRYEADSALASTWSWSRDNATTAADARRLLVETLARINRRDPAKVESKAEPFGEKDVHLFQQNDYFPHVSGHDLSLGFYESLDKVQGSMNTYFASGLNGYETVEFALRAGKDVVEHYMK